MNFTSLIAKGDVYQDHFAEDGYAINGEFNILHLDRHGGFIGAYKFLLSWVINFQHSQNL